MFRDKQSKLSFKSDFTLKETRNYNKNSLITTQSRDTTLLTNSLKYNYRHQFKNVTGYTPPISGTFLTLSHIKGTSWFNATNDPGDIMSTEAHNQFDKLSLNAAHSIPFLKTFIYKIDFDTDYSFDTLNGSERFAIGGPYSVRGFDENSISGDGGYAIKNTIEARLFKAKYINDLLFSVFHDYGYVRNKKIISEVGEGYMSGAGVRVRYPDNKYFNWDLTYSRGLHSPKFIQNIYNQEKDRETIYFNVTANVSLF